MHSPFTIAVAQRTLDDLRERLARTRRPEEVQEAGWDYGTNLEYLKALVAYWQHHFDWRAQETKLNHFAQFRAVIDGFGIHFIARVALFPKEISLPPHEWAERTLRVQRWTHMPRGGHFAALEEPELLIEELRTFFRPLRVTRDFLEGAA